MYEAKRYPMWFNRAFFGTVNVLLYIAALLGACATVNTTHRPNTPLIVAYWMIGATVFAYLLKKMMFRFAEHSQLLINECGLQLLVTRKDQEYVSEATTVTYDYLDHIYIKKKAFNYFVLVRTIYGKTFLFSAGSKENAEAICKEVVNRMECYAYEMAL